MTQETPSMKVGLLVVFLVTGIFAVGIYMGNEKSVTGAAVGGKSLATGMVWNEKNTLGY